MDERAADAISKNAPGLAWPVQTAATIIFLTGLMGVLFVVGSCLTDLLERGYIVLDGEHLLLCLIYLALMLSARGLLQVRGAWRQIALMLLWAGVFCTVFAMCISGWRLMREASYSDEATINAVIDMVTAMVFMLLVVATPLLLLTCRKAVRQFGLPYSKMRRGFVLVGIGAALACVAALAISYLP